MVNQAQKQTLALLFGGRSGEHEVSLLSARSVLSALNPQNYRILQVGITPEGAWLTGEEALSAFEQGKTEGLQPVCLLPDPSRPGLYLTDGAALRPYADVDVYFPVLHGTFGEDGALQGLLELADVAYVGAGVTASAVGMDKGIFKQVMRAQNIPVVAEALLLRHEVEEDLPQALARAEAVAPYPLFVKPANLGSSVGVTKCRTRADLLEGLMEAAQYDTRILVEQGIPNPREIEIAILGNHTLQASVAGEILPGADFYSYEAKYILEGSQALIPAPLSAEQARQVSQYALRACQAVGVQGMARVDFLLSQEGKVYLNEINTIPGFTNISMYPKLWQASGLSYADLVQRLVELAQESKAERARSLHTYRRRA